MRPESNPCLACAKFRQCHHAQRGYLCLDFRLIITSEEHYANEQTARRKDPLRHSPASACRSRYLHRDTRRLA